MRAAILVLLLSTAAWAQPSVTVLHALKGKTLVRASFPHWLPREYAKTYPQVNASAHTYTVTLGWSPGGGDSMANSAGLFQVLDDAAVEHEWVRAEGARRRRVSRREFVRSQFEQGQRVPVRPGVVGYYSAPTGSVDGGSTTLTWREHGLHYYFQLRRTVSQADMLHAARSL